jgi:nitrile hydratase accessory protein
LKPFDEEPVFSEPWEAQAFAMAVKLNETGRFTWSEWSEMLARQIAANPEHSYYENWLSALENIVERKAMITRGERLHCIEDWDHAARATPHGKPIELTRLGPAKEIARSTSRTFPASSL